VKIVPQRLDLSHDVYGPIKLYPGSSRRPVLVGSSLPNGQRRRTVNESPPYALSGSSRRIRRFGTMPSRRGSAICAGLSTLRYLLLQRKLR
jgi:hypothetical protein